MHTLPLHLVEALIAFYREQTMVGAARAIQSTQPTISRQLQKLQDILGEPLVEERGRNKVLTPFGIRMANAAESCWADFGQAVQNVRLEILPKERIQLRVVGRSEVLKRFFGNLITTNPIELIPLNSDETRLSLQRREADIAIYQGNFVSSEYARKKFFKDVMGVAIPKTALGAASSWKEWLKFGSPLGLALYKSELLNLFSKSAREGVAPLLLPKPVFIFPDWSVIEERVARGLNWGFLPSTYANIEKGSPYAYFPLDTIEEQTFFIYYRLKLGRLPWMKALIASNSKVKPV
jgi:DNA-binding transcriptional LysR family regulator